MTLGEVMKHPSKFGKEQHQAAQQFGYLLMNLMPEDMSKLGGSDLLEKLFQAGKRHVVEAEKSIFNWSGEAVSGHDMSVMLNTLITVLDQLGIHIADDKITSIFVPEGKY